jgi:PAS domain S-box-containing protein
MTSEPPGVNEGPRSRMTVVVGVEWTMLMLRYVLYVFMAAFSVASDVSDLSRIIIVAGGSALAHNIFAHAVLYLRAYHLFLSPINFFIYLGRFCLLLAVTGGAASPFAPFLLFLLIAYHVYIPSGMNSFRATFVVCTFYSFTVLLVWVIDGMDWMHLPLYLNLCYIAFCGWLMYMMARVVIQLNHEALRQSIALQSSESTLRAILDHAAHPILVFDEHNTITDLNDSAIAFLGAPRERLIGKSFHSYIFDDGSLHDSLEELRESGALDREMLLIPHDRGERNVEMHIHSFLKDSSRFYVVLFHDITEQRELEETSQMAKARLEEANRELQHVVALRVEFYANVANRLRSPLSSMLGFTEMLLEEQLGEINDEQRRALHSCRRSITRIFDLIEDAFAPDAFAKIKEATAKTAAGRDESGIH